MEDIAALIDRVESGTKAPRKGRDIAIAEADFSEDEDEEDVLKTPKKRKTSAAATPKKNRTPSKLLTPSHKRYNLALFQSERCANFI